MSANINRYGFVAIKRRPSKNDAAAGLPPPSFSDDVVVDDDVVDDVDDDDDDDDDDEPFDVELFSTLIDVDFAIGSCGSAVAGITAKNTRNSTATIAAHTPLMANNGTTPSDSALAANNGPIVWVLLLLQVFFFLRDQVLIYCL